LVAEVDFFHWRRKNQKKTKDLLSIISFVLLCIFCDSKKRGMDLKCSHQSLPCFSPKIYEPQQWQKRYNSEDMEQSEIQIKKFGSSHSFVHFVVVKSN